MIYTIKSKSKHLKKKLAFRLNIKKIGKRYILQVKNYLSLPI